MGISGTGRRLAQGFAVDALIDISGFLVKLTQHGSIIRLATPVTTPVMLSMACFLGAEHPTRRLAHALRTPRIITQVPLPAVCRFSPMLLTLNIVRLPKPLIRSA